ncbi:MAG: sugar ABC transporter ATP-binding protein, partial [Planctomycetota bacterium]|nr:sugar ABC transporter ATP-binding protein [Planctomycetota bacterium]
VDRAARRALAERALARLGDGAPAPDTRVAELGPGPRQLVEIARALASDARVIVFDEPTSSLSRRDAEHLFEVVERLRSDGCSVIWIGHFLEEIQRVADRWTVLRDGATVGTGVVAGTEPATWVTLMAGRAVEEFFPPRERAPGEVLLELDGLGGEGLPVEATLSLRRGEILGLAGLVGAGRTELLRALFGLEPVRAGRVRLAAADLGQDAPAERIAQGFGLASEDRKAEGLALERSIAFNLTLSRPVALRGVRQPAAEAEAVSRWIRSLGVRCRDGAQAIGELSGGNQQKVALARLLHQDAEVLLLDEPTRGVDVGAKVEIYRLLGQLAAQGKALLVVSSYFPELLGICDRIAVMHRGRLGPARPADAWTETTLLDAAARGEGDAA